MTSRVLTLLAAATFMGAGAIGFGTAGAAEPMFQKIPSKGVELTKKGGYWTECRYSGLGTVCETIYMRAKNGKFRKLPANEGRLKRKGGQVLVCYDGSHNAQVCYWVYSPRKASR